MATRIQGSGYDGWKENLVAYIVWSSEEHEVKALEVIERYRGHGLSKDLLSEAWKDGANLLTVNSKNTAAINLYTSLGYKTSKISGAMIYMKK